MPAAGAADDEAPPQGLPLLTTHDATTLRLQLRAGHAVLRSAHPVHAIWVAHRSDAARPLCACAPALAAGQGDARARAPTGPAAGGRTHRRRRRRLRAGAAAGARSLATALHAAGTAFDFEAWLIITTLQHGGLAAVRHIAKDNA
jgi:hypothetical protein